MPIRKPQWKKPAGKKASKGAPSPKPAPKRVRAGKAIEPPKYGKLGKPKAAQGQEPPPAPAAEPTIPEPPKFYPNPPDPRPPVGRVMVEYDTVDDPTIHHLSSYKPGYCEIARHLYQVFGATEQEVAAFFGVGTMTLVSWRMKHPEFMASCQLAMVACTDRVERALYSRAVGYSHAEEKIFCTKLGEIIRADTVKQYPPDVTAAQFWLINQRNKTWRMTQAVSVETPDLISTDDLVNKLLKKHS